jgi:6-phosphogluconolactonase (cycloisomerase 2 family)
METNERMSKRFWLLGLIGLISAGLLVACGSKYDSSSQGLVVVGSQASNVLQTFSFNLNSGHAAGISNPASTPTQPSSIVMDVTGTYAYVILAPTGPTDPASLGVFKVNSGGTLSQVADPIPFAQTSQANVVPSMLARDAAGKFLFSANRSTTDVSGNPVPGSISVFAIGGGGSVTEVAGSPFSTPATLSPVDIVSVAATPTVFPGTGINGTQNAVCSIGSNPPTAEYLYAADKVGAQLFEFQVDTSSGALTVPDHTSTVPAFPTDAQPEDVAVDPCARFVYVSGSLHNRISAYRICSTVGGVCTFANGALVEVSGSPFPAQGSANALGPLVVDPYGDNVYVVGTASNTVSGFKISPVSGSLTALSPATVATGSQPKSIAIRADDNWMFVSNYGSASVSQYSITPATGNLSVLPTLSTDNNPFGVAVK